jgi:hypothetical protein
MSLGRNQYGVFGQRQRRSPWMGAEREPAQPETPASARISRPIPRANMGSGREGATGTAESRLKMLIYGLFPVTPRRFACLADNAEKTAAVRLAL